MLRIQNREDKYPGIFSVDFLHNGWFHQPDDETTPGVRLPMDGQANTATQDRVQVPYPVQTLSAVGFESHQTFRVRDGSACGRLRRIQFPKGFQHLQDARSQYYFCLFEMSAQWDELVEDREHQTPWRRCSRSSWQDRAACHVRRVNPTNAGMPRTMLRKQHACVQRECVVEIRARCLPSGLRVLPSID